MSGARIKVCGLTRIADVTAAVDLGAWAVGFVVWPRSPRAVSLTRIAELAASVPPGVRRVGVTVNPGLEDVKRLREEAGLTTVQLHGDEDVSDFLDLGLEVIKAVSLGSGEDVERAAALPAEVMVLVDSHDPVRRGGTGQRADWAWAAALSKRRPLLLAGGIRAENVREALESVAPWGLDVSSGLESAPGIKDQDRMEQFFSIVRGGAVGK